MTKQEYNEMQEYSKRRAKIVEHNAPSVHKFETPSFEHEIFVEDKAGLLIGTAKTISVFWNVETGHCFAVCSNKRLSRYDLKKKKLDYKRLDFKNRYATGDYIAVCRIKSPIEWIMFFTETPSFDSDFEWKLIHKKDNNVLLKYLNQLTYKTPVQIQYRWHDEPWMDLETDFIESYEESTQYKIL